MYGDPPKNPQSATGIRIAPFEFTGQAGEYFRIWIVNLLLTVLTLGIYSAWAKVRNRRYFLGHTLLDGEPFDYLASPVAILKGRLIAAAILVGFSVWFHFDPQAQPIGTALFALVLPWLVVRSLMFNARNIAYRNVTLGFNENYRESYRVYLLTPIIVALTLGLAYPYFVFVRQRFLVTNHEAGITPLTFTGGAKAYFRLYALGTLLFLVMMFAFGTLGYFLMRNVALTSLADPRAVMMSTGPLITLILFAVYLGVYTFLATHVTNITLNNTHVGDHRLESRLQASTMVWLNFTNTLAIACSLGLLIPWAKVRMARYRNSCLRVYVHNALDDLFVGAPPRVSAAGEEISDLLAVDIGL